MKKLMTIILSIACLPFSLNAGKKQTQICPQDPMKEVIHFIIQRKQARMKAAIHNTAIELAPGHLGHLHTTIAPHK